jgi:large subunit ribosomal protein L21
MYAIVKVGGSQYRVTVGDTIKTQKIPGEPGTEVSFDQVLLLSNDQEMRVGTPMIEGANVKAVIQKQDRDKKVLVVKFKRRKGYRRKNGHRQHYTRLEITDIASQ